MQAIHIESFLPASISYPDGLRPSSVPIPKPHPANLLIAIAYSSLNHVDLLYSRGLHQNNKSGLVKPPFNLGLEFSGVVVALPTDSQKAKESGFAIGDRVWGGCVGSYAEYVLLPPTAVRKLPDETSLLDAAGLGAGSPTVSYGALVLCGGVKKGNLVLVHAAAGGLGVPAVQIAHAIGAKVIATVGSDAKAEVVRKEMGESVVGVVNYEVDGWEKEVVKIAKREGKEGVDVAYDTVGLVLSSIRCVRFGGAVVIAGFAGRKGKMEMLAMNRILLKNVRVLGYRYGESGRRDSRHTAECWRATEELLAQGRMKPLIYTVHQGLSAVGQGLQELYERRVWGKAVVEIKKEEQILQEIATAKPQL